MADLAKTIEIIFSAVDNTGQVMTSIADNLHSTLDGAAQIAEPLAEVADAAIKAQTAVLALATVYGGVAMQKAAEFQSAQIDLNKVLSEGDPAIESFTGTVVELSEKYGVSSAAILQGISNFKQAGFTAQEAAGLQKNALDLIIAGDIDAARASDILVQAIKGFGADASEATRYIEALNNVSNDYATDINQLAEGVSRVAPIMKVMGFSFEESTGLLTPMIEIFGSGAEAAEALKTGMLKLIDDAKPVKDALASLGVSQLDLNGHMRSGHDIFYDVAEAFKKVEENQKLVFAGQLFGIDQAPKLVAVFNDLAKVNQVTASAMETTGSVAKEVDLRLASTAKQADIFKVSFENLAIAIGTKLNGQFDGIVSGSSDILQAFRQIVEQGGLDQFFEALKPAMASFADTLHNIAQNLPTAFAGVDFSGLIDSMRGVGGALGGIFDGIDLDTPEGLTRAIQFVVDSLESLSNVTAGIIEAWDPMVRGFISAIDAFNSLDASTQQTVGNISGLGQVFQFLFEGLSGGVDAIESIAGALTTLAEIRGAESVVNIANTIRGMDFTAATTSLTAFGRQLLMPNSVAAIAAIGAVGFAVNQNISAWDEYKQRQESVAESTQSLGETQEQITAKLADITSSTGVAVTSMTEFNAAVDDGRLVFNEATGTWESASQAIASMGDGLADATTSSFDFVSVANGVANSLDLVGSSAGDAVGTFFSLADAEAAAILEMDKGNTTSITYADGLYTLHSIQGEAASSADDLAVATKDAAIAAGRGTVEWQRIQDVLLDTQREANEFAIKLGELANERYEIDVRANVDLQIAEIEADTARIQAAFQSTSDAIAALAPEVSNLWATFAGLNNKAGTRDIERAALRMEDRLDQELDIQSRLADATIENLNARRDRLRSGEALINISSGDLAPELDALFEKILKRVQIKGTEEGLGLLLGLGSS